MPYLWIKACHLIAVVAWFAALFYLPRLFVYHAMANDQISRDRFKIMERKLYHGIMTPAGLIATALGAWMTYLNPSLLHFGWFHSKLALVTCLWANHLYLNHLRKLFMQDQNHHTHTFYRWLNEVPTAILIAVVILTIVKPF